MGKSSPTVMQYDQELDFALGALAAGDVILQETKIDSSRAAAWFMKWLMWSAFFTGKTTDEGPIVIGFSANMNAQEVEDWMEADAQSRADNPDKVPAGWIRPLFMIGKSPTAGSVCLSGTNLVSPMTFLQVNWSILEAQAFSVWARNQDASGLTTGTALVFHNQYAGRWIRD